MYYHDSYKPDKILKVYRNGDKKYIEIHDVKENQNGFIEGPGRPLTLEAYQKMFSITAGNEKGLNLFFKNKIMSPDIISFYPHEPTRHICWYDKARQRKIQIATSKGVKNLFLWMPATLYYVKNGNLNIYALRTNKRPVTSTWLYKMPLPNMTSHSTFCWGNVPVKDIAKTKFIDEEIKEWTQAVWNSQFDEYNIGKLFMMYTALHKSGKRFSKKDLMYLTLTLKDVLK